MRLNVFAMSETRTRIIDAAAGLMAEQGFNRTSIDDVIAHAALSGKSHFYHYFRSKEQLGLAVLDRQFGRFEEQGLSILRDASIDPLERIHRLIDAVCFLQEEFGIRSGPPFGDLALEMAEEHSGARAHLALAFKRWASQIQTLLFEAGPSLQEGVDAAHLSRFIIATLEGALMLSKVTGDAEMVREVATDLKRFVSTRVRAGASA